MPWQSVAWLTASPCRDHPVKPMLSAVATLHDAWNVDATEKLVVHLSLPWSAELYAQANARLVRQGQCSTVSIHVMLSSGAAKERLRNGQRIGYHHRNRRPSPATVEAVHARRLEPPI
jgi:hypothetical protein